MVSGEDRAAPRFVDPARTVLTGVGAEQRVSPAAHGHGDRLEAPGPYDVWRRKPSIVGRPGDTTYYDRPVIKEPVWIWAVPAYFYAGGAAGAAALLGAVAQTTGDLDGLVRRCRWITTVGTTAGTGFLVVDLGRPARFLNMLRVFRPTSPMSLGSWLLAATAGAATTAAVLSSRDGAPKFLADVAGIAAGAMGMPLASYTAVLIANTAVPAWQGARRSLPLLFTASSVAGAASLLELLPGTAREHAVARAFGIVGAVGELAAGPAVEHEAARVEAVARPYHEGASGALWKGAKVATVAALLLRGVPGGSRWRRVLAGLLGTTGSLTLRFAVFQAGKRSARQPQATFRQQRQGYGAAEVTGTAAVTGAGARRALD